MRATRDSYDVREVALDLLREPAVNPNRMLPSTYELLVEAIRTVGFLQPVLAQEEPDGTLTIVDGVHRTRAAKEVGLACVPVVVGDFRDDPDLARVVQIGMNRMRGELNLSAVAQQVSALVEKGWSTVQLELTGFSRDELDDLLASTRHSDDEVLEGGLGAAPDASDDDDAAPKPFVLELTFEKKEQLTRAKRGLRKAAGKGRELADGLLRLLDGA